MLSTNGGTEWIGFLAAKAGVLSCHRWIMGVSLRSDDSWIGREWTTKTLSHSLRVWHMKVCESITERKWKGGGKQKAIRWCCQQNAHLNTQTHIHRHGWSNRSPNQYRAVTRYSALYQSLLIGTYKNQVDTRKGYCKDFHLFLKKKNRENPYAIHSNLFLFVLHVIRSHLADMVYECTTLPQHGWLP